MQTAIGVGLTTDENWDEFSTYVIEAERLGVASVWSAEAWGHDAATPLAYLAAKTSRIKLGSGIMQTIGRTPANTAMTAMSLASLSGGRFILGLGVSGPQVVEGWAGLPYQRPPPPQPQPTIPVYLATLSPNSLELTGEVADGWIGTSFMPEHADVFFDHVRRGAKKAGRSLKDLDLMAGGAGGVSAPPA